MYHTTHTGGKCPKDCVTCPKIKFTNFVTSHITRHRVRTIKNPTSNCKSTQLIYLITCTICKLQYVGETQTSLAKRMSHHKWCFKTDQSHTVLSDHFKLPGHTPEDFEINILDNLDCTTKQIRLSKELFWIKLLRTAAPFGLNDQIKGGYGNISNGQDPFSCANNPYQGITIKQNFKTHGVRKPTSKLKQPIDLDHIISQFIDLEMYDIYRLLRQLKQYQLDLIIDYIMEGRDFLALSSNTKLKMYAGLSNHFWRNHTDKQKEKSHRLILHYSNQNMNNLNIKKIFNNNVIRKLLETNTTKPILRTTVQYTYDRPFSTSIFNYNKVLRSLNHTAIQNIMTSPCICSSEHYAKFVNPHFGHIIQGNCHMFQETDITNVLSKGTKYRISNRIQPMELRQNILNKCIDHVNTLQRIYKFKAPAKSEMLANITQSCSTMTIPPPIYQDEFKGNIRQLREQICNIQKDFIITSVDKASCNYSFTCLKQYLIFMNEEMGYHWQSNTTRGLNDTYTIYNKESATDIVKRHATTNASILKKSISPEFDKIPNIYGIPKMHKTPIKFRFITGARLSSTKEVAVEIKNILVCIKQHFKRYCRTIEARNNIRLYWSIDSSYELIDMLKTAKVKKTIYTADFASLFTNLPHKSVLDSITIILKKCFRNSNHEHGYISVNPMGKYSYHDTPRDNHSYNIHDICYMLMYILDNSFAKYGDHIYKQVKGIPQGFSCSPLLADLTLLCMEYKFVMDNQNRYRKNDFLACRYMDDIFVMTDNIDPFLLDTQNMYDSSLTLEKTSTSDKECNFLDLCLDIHNNRIHHKLYNKTDDYDFVILKYPQAMSNVHCSLALNTIHGEITRFYRCCSSIEDFRTRSIELLQVMMRNRHDKSTVSHKIFKTMISNHLLLRKYSLKTLDAVKQFVSALE